MKTMYERVKEMTMEEMQNFVYWVYLHGANDERNGLQDSPGECSYFGGAMLKMVADDVMPNVDPLEVC